MKLSMRSVLIPENQLVEQAVHIWIEETGMVCSQAPRFGIIGGNGPCQQFLDLSREVPEEPFNDRAVAFPLGWAKDEIDGVVGSVVREHPCQILQAVRMVCPGIVQQQLQGDAVTCPFLLYSQIKM